MPWASKKHGTGNKNISRVTAGVFTYLEGFKSFLFIPVYKGAFPNVLGYVTKKGLFHFSIC